MRFAIPILEIHRNHSKLASPTQPMATDDPTLWGNVADDDDDYTFMPACFRINKAVAEVRVCSPSYEMVDASVLVARHHGVVVRALVDVGQHALPRDSAHARAGCVTRAGGSLSEPNGTTPAWLPSCVLVGL